jgi:hypothetical protein
MKKIFYLLLVFFFNANTAFSKTNEIELELAKAVRSVVFVDKVLNGYGVVGMPRQVLREHIQELYKNDEVISLLVKEIINAGVETWDKDKLGDYGKRFGAELFVNYAMKGMARLSLEEQRTFIRFMHNWMKIASDEDCKKMLTNGGTTNALDDANIEMKYYDKMEREELRAYFLMIRKSIVAEIQNFPSAKNLNQQQAKIADNAFENELRKRIELGLIDDRTITAMADMPSANPKLACAAGKQIFSTMLSMKGFSAELFLTKFILSLQ